jgi:hypothetical protein
MTDSEPMQEYLRRTDRARSLDDTLAHYEGVLAEAQHQVAAEKRDAFLAELQRSAV